MVPALASGMQLGSPLLDVFQATRSPGAFRELGGVVAVWRLSVHGDQDVLGVREVTHVADTGFGERDRLEYGDGRVAGRCDGQVFAARGGMPWPTLVDAAAPELLLFGMHLRLPWLFAAHDQYAVVRRDVEQRQGERLNRIVVERRPDPADDRTGPVREPIARDRFELWCEPSTGLPRELVHRLACSGETRRVLLEDWREVGGVRLPHRRVYVDGRNRATTTLELLRLERRRVSDRDFRVP